MKKRKSVGERTEPCGTPLFIVIGVELWPSTTAETNITFEAYLGPMLTKGEKGYKEAVLEHF